MEGESSGQKKEPQRPKLQASVRRRLLNKTVAPLNAPSVRSGDLRSSSGSDKRDGSGGLPIPGKRVARTAAQKSPTHHKA